MEFYRGPVWRIDWQVNEEAKGKIMIEQYAMMRIDTESDTCVECVDMEGLMTLDIQSSPFYRKANWCSVYITTEEALRAKLRNLLTNHYKFQEEIIEEAITEVLETLNESIHEVDFDPRNN